MGDKAIKMFFISTEIICHKINPILKNKIYLLTYSKLSNKIPMNKKNDKFNRKHQTIEHNKDHNTQTLQNSKIDSKTSNVSLDKENWMKDTYEEILLIEWPDISIVLSQTIRVTLIIIAFITLLLAINTS